MTRKEEIIQTAINKNPRFAERRIGFIAGAEWADKTLTEKACAWLKAFLESHNIYSYALGCNPINDAVLTGFRKAMEE